MRAQNVPDERITVLRRAHLKYAGTDTALPVTAGGTLGMITEFEEAHRQRYGFVMEEKPLVVEAAVVEVIGSAAAADGVAATPPTEGAATPLAVTKSHMAGAEHDTLSLIHI